MYKTQGYVVFLYTFSDVSFVCFTYFAKLNENMLLDQLFHGVQYLQVILDVHLSVYD